ncbi:MAG: hypothetical protein LVR00_08530 [Rhabdochlamydiaceae bacterium]|jgi:hypothetical protein
MPSPVALRSLSYLQFFLQRLQTHPTIHYAVTHPRLSSILKTPSPLLPFLEKCVEKSPALPKEIIYIALSSLIIREIWDKCAPTRAHINYPQISNALAFITGGALTAAAGTFSIPSALFTAWCFSILQYTKRKEREHLREKLGMQKINPGKGPLLIPSFAITDEIIEFAEKENVKNFDIEDRKYALSIKKAQDGKHLSTEDQINIFIYFQHRSYEAPIVITRDSMEDLSSIAEYTIKLMVKSAQTLNPLYLLHTFLNENGITRLTRDLETADFLSKIQKSLKRGIPLSKEDKSAFFLILMVHKTYNEYYKPHKELAAALNARPSDCCQVFETTYRKSVQEKLERMEKAMDIFNHPNDPNYLKLAELIRLIGSASRNMSPNESLWQERMKECFNSHISTLNNGVIPDTEEHNTNQYYLIFCIHEKFPDLDKEKLKTYLTGNKHMPLKYILLNFLNDQS